MKLLEDIPVTPVETLKKLAAMAAVDEPAPAAPKVLPPASGAGAAPRGESRPYAPAGNGEGLGPLDVGRYLAHFGVKYEIKDRAASGGRTVYALMHCLFDMKHGKGEAAVIQDTTGRITYHCYHQSCNHTWADARRVISGEEKLAQFCAGYDPNRHRAGGDGKSRAEKNAEKHDDPPSPFDSGRDGGGVDPDVVVSGDGKVPEPSDIVPGWFFDNKRFMPQYLAKYLEAYLDPIKYDGSSFYKYQDCGFWVKFPADKICQYGEMAMDKHASSAKINDAVTLLGHRVFVEPEEFKHDPGFINLKSGMLDINTLDMSDHDPKYNSRFQLPVRYDLAAKAERWHQFLEEVFPGPEGKEKALCLQSFFGYCLVPDCRYQRCLFLIGSGSNGKSVIIDILVDLIGQENVSSLPMQLFSQRFLIGQLKDKLINVAGEISTQGPIETDVFKNAVTGGLLMADEKHGKPFGFYPHAKHIFAMNDVPKISDKSYGFTRRPIVLKFTEQFDGDRKDPNLINRLREELDGIFVWMLEGLHMILYHKDLYVPGVVESDGAEFIKTTNPVLVFFDECCTIGEEKFCAPQKLYDSYLSWCESGQQRPMSRNNFYSQIMLHLKTVRRVQMGPDRVRVFKGIGLAGVL